jgi:uncharacterized protein (TIGR00725 family)
MRRAQVVVIGASDDTAHLEEARSIGALVAGRNCTLLTGGRGGIMEAASRGAAENGGEVIGIIPGDSFSGANRYCTTVIATGIGYARNSINILSGDIIIAIGGKSGTLTELAYAWQFNKPVICCMFADGWSSMFPGIKVDDRVGSEIYEANGLEQVAVFLDDFLNRFRSV